MRRTWPIQLTALMLPMFLVGCAGSMRSYRYDEHAIRIDERQGRRNADVYVDGCRVRGVYYDEGSQRWGVHGYTYGPSHFELEVLAEDLASWGAADWCDPRRAPPGLGQRAEASSPPDA